MGSRISRLASGALLVTLVTPVGAHANNGYFPVGVGTKQKGLGGAGVALPTGPSGGATNPATTAFACRGYEAAVALFLPHPEYIVTGSMSRAPGTFGLVAGTVESDDAVVPIPQAAAGWMLGTGCLSVAFYGNGGIETEYDAPTFFGRAPAGLSLQQFFVSPSVSVKVGERHAFGASPVVAFQRFRARGLEALGPFSTAPDALTGTDHQTSLGAGARVGYYARLSDRVAVGAAYRSPIVMGRLDRYAGLLAGGGDLDVPAAFVGGIALTPTDTVAVAVDVEHIRYGDIDALGNPLLPNLRDRSFGDEGGPGFGWDNTTALKAGAQWQQSGGWWWRGGYAFGESPIAESETLLNILAPAVAEHHATFGVTRALGSGRELNVALMRAFSNRVSGRNPFEVTDRQQIDLRMDQWEFEIGIAIGF